jgi:ketosteroid isomerase-like protein
VIDAGESVVLNIRQWGRGKGSGAPVSDEFWQVWTFRDGKVIHRTRHQDRAAALEAARLA